MMGMDKLPASSPSVSEQADVLMAAQNDKAVPQEIGGSKRPEPTRYGDWEIAGKCVDF